MKSLWRLRYLYGQKGQVTAAVVGLVFVLLCIGTAVSFWFVSSYQSGALIADDVECIARIIERVHSDSGIIRFTHDATVVDFLNVRSFVGSQVGSITLAQPDKWQGPYLVSNPTAQDVEYQIINTQQGLFVVPGNGVTLPNGKLIGADLILTRDSDIGSMMYDPEKLFFNGKPLAAKIELDPKLSVNWAAIGDEEASH